MGKLAIPPITDEEETRIQAGIAQDPDNPEWTEEDFRNARPFAEVFPQWAAEIRRSRGRPASETPRKIVSIRLDQDGTWSSVGIFWENWGTFYGSELAVDGAVWHQPEES